MKLLIYKVYQDNGLSYRASRVIGRPLKMNDFGVLRRVNSMTLRKHGYRGTRSTINICYNDEYTVFDNTLHFKKSITDNVTDNFVLYGRNVFRRYAFSDRTLSDFREFIYREYV